MESFFGTIVCCRMHLHSWYAKWMFDFLQTHIKFQSDPCLIGAGVMGLLLCNISLQKKFLVTAHLNDAHAWSGLFYHSFRHGQYEGHPMGERILLNAQYLGCELQPGLRDLPGWSGGLRCLRYTHWGTADKVLGGRRLRRCGRGLRWKGNCEGQE